MITLALLVAASAATGAIPIRGGVGFDDLEFSPALDRSVVAGGRNAP